MKALKAFSIFFVWFEVFSSCVMFRPNLTFFEIFFPFDSSTKIRPENQGRRNLLSLPSLSSGCTGCVGSLANSPTKSLRWKPGRKGSCYELRDAIWIKKLSLHVVSLVLMESYGFKLQFFSTAQVGSVRAWFLRMVCSTDRRGGRGKFVGWWIGSQWHGPCSQVENTVGICWDIGVWGRQSVCVFQNLSQW